MLNKIVLNHKVSGGKGNPIVEFLTMDFTFFISF